MMLNFINKIHVKFKEKLEQHNYVNSINQTRVDFVDVSKGICIILVIVGHLGVKYFNYAIYPFHIPLFFLIAGFFIRKEENFSKFIKKKFKTILVPFLILLVFLFLINISKEIINKTISIESIWIFLQKCFYCSASSDNKTFFSIGPIGASWFLPTLFWSLLFTKIFLRFKYGFIFSIILFVFAVVTRDYFWLPLGLSSACSATFFVMIGYYIWNNQILFNNKINMIFVIIGIVIYLFELIFFDRWVEVGTNYYRFYGVGAIFSIFVSIFIINISRILSKNNFTRYILSFYGRNSFLVYFFHCIESFAFNYLIAYEFFKSINLSIYVSVLVLLLTKIIFCSLATYIVLYLKKQI